VNRYIRRTPYRTIEEARAFIDKITEGIQQGSWIFWAIALKESGRLIGTICLWNIQPVNHRAEIGYELHPDYWGQGVIKNALPKVIKYAFRTMKLHSLEADLDPANLASARVLERTGFVKEGHF
jgi:ribosomal-protein-alanine N-acetyltransferase